MIEVRETQEYADWFSRLRDRQAKARILARIRRVSLGNCGDAQPAGEGVSELRIHYGPGYRVYFVQQGSIVVVLLCGGVKDTQEQDIRDAKGLAQRLKE